jgi:hypothetical protein
MSVEVEYKLESVATGNEFAEKTENLSSKILEWIFDLRAWQRSLECGNLLPPCFVKFISRHLDGTE